MTTLRKNNPELSDLALDEIEIIEKIAKLYLSYDDPEIKKSARLIIRKCRLYLQSGRPTKDQLRQINRLIYRLLLK